MKIPSLLIGLILASLSGCAKKPPPVSVDELMANPRLLEATMVRCTADRRLRYEAACVNARGTSRRLQLAAENARREELERQSEMKRQALRESREVADAARRRALEEQKLREEAEYHGQFEAVQDEVQRGPGTVAAGDPPDFPENG